MLSEPRKRPPSGGGGTQPTQRADAAEHVTPAHVPKAAVLTSGSRQHIFEGEINSEGRAVGWHHEPSGKRSRGTYVIEGTRSEPDKHGVYTAEVVIEGKRKARFSTFFPKDWSQEKVEAEIAHAYQNRIPGKHPLIVFGYGSSGIKIKMIINGSGEIQTVFPLKGLGQ